MKNYSVIVSNCGEVFTSDNLNECCLQFDNYKIVVDSNNGKLSGEIVTLLDNIHNDIIDEHTGKLYIGIVEIGESVATIMKQGNVLLAGDIANCGFYATNNMDYDDDFSLDENLQEFIEQLEEGEYNGNINN